MFVDDRHFASGTSSPSRSGLSARDALPARFAWPVTPSGVHDVEERRVASSGVELSIATGRSTSFPDFAVTLRPVDHLGLRRGARRVLAIVYLASRIRECRLIGIRLRSSRERHIPSLLRELRPTADRASRPSFFGPYRP